MPRVPQPYNRLITILRSCEDLTEDRLVVRSLSGTLNRGQQHLAAPLAQRLSTPGADFSACAYSRSVRLVPSDRPRNCFGEPFCWVASIKARAVFFQVWPHAGPSCFQRRRHYKAPQHPTRGDGSTPAGAPAPFLVGSADSTQATEDIVYCFICWIVLCTYVRYSASVMPSTE